MKLFKNRQQSNEEHVMDIVTIEALGKLLISVAIINILEILAKMVVRNFVDDSVNTDMIEIYVGDVRLLLVVIMFILCVRTTGGFKAKSTIERKLLMIWGIILIPVQLINDLCGMLYTRMLDVIKHVFDTAQLDQGGQIYAMIYDSTHGFKYICMLMAILLGIIVTGEMLDKRSLIVFCLIVAVMFMTAFTILRMQTFAIDEAFSFAIGINWTSMIFHMLTTFGLFYVGIYIHKVSM